MGAKKNIRIFCIVVIVQCIVIMTWGTQKERLNVDEMFTMEGAKQGGNGMRYWDISEDFYGNEHTNAEFLSHLTVYEDELLIYQGLPTVIKSLGNRNLYYVIINLAASIYPGHIPWLVGVVVNLIYFVIAQFVLYLLMQEIHSDVAALCSVIIYGFSAGAISMVLYVRCYMMLTMLELLLVYLYIRFVKTEKWWERLICLICSGVLALVSYRTHQFGTILFAVITALFLIYIVANKKKKCMVWLTAVYGILFVGGIRVILPRIHGFLSGNIAELFYCSVKNISLEQLFLQFLQLSKIIAEHLFANVSVMFLAISVMFVLCMVEMYREKKKHILNSMQMNCERKNRVDWIIIMLIGLVAIIYYSILLLGNAVAWKYMSPAYPIVVMVFTVGICSIWRYLGHYKMLIPVIGVCLLLASYDTQHISEMYTGEKACREELEMKYHGVNGIMVHHDSQGIGQNWLYEAATLWPQDSNVMVIQNRMLYEKELCYNREDNKILLWLTGDYDNEEAINRFRELTEYTKMELVMSTDSLRIFECNK
ncbi:MAG: hypothetical protein HFI60_00520 [Lachnospiraceae bacterium]|jgi:hypothetical protein|nr:hypothetical protein [Lachnospiraceae bacterium]